MSQATFMPHAPDASKSWPLKASRSTFRNRVEVHHQLTYGSKFHMTNPSSFRPIIAHMNSRITYYNISIMKHCINCLRSTVKLSLPYSHKSSLLSRLSFSQAARSMSTKTEPQFSSNYNPIQGHQALGTLLKDGGGRWTLLSNGMGIERSFKFKGFKKTWVCRIPYRSLIHIMRLRSLLNRWSQIHFYLLDSSSQLLWRRNLY